MSTSNDNSARSAILDSVRRNLQISAPFDHVHKVHGDLAIDGKEGNTPAIQTPDLAALLCDKLVAVNGQVQHVESASEAAIALQKIIDELWPRRIAFSDSQMVRSVLSLLRTEAQLLDTAAAAELFRCDVGITSAQLAIAETGTLVLESTKEFNRLTSLIPETHICLLETGKIRRTMGEVLQLMAADLSPAVTFITGPSRTSDIELTLAIGVHGPRRLFVIVIDTSSAVWVSAST